MATNQRVDLANLFQNVTQTLEQNQQNLDQMDEYNHDHGDNMVKTFQTITTALEKKRGTSDSAALGYAAKQLSRTATSSSSKLYAENLAQAATQFRGKQVDSKGALDLLTTLIGAGQAASQPTHNQQPAGSDDLLGALMGGLGGGSAPQQQPSMGSDDLLGSLLGGLGGSSSQSSSSGGGDLLGSLLGGLGGGSAPQQQSSSSGGDDLLGSLLGGLTGQSGGSSQNSGGSGIGLQNLLAAGMAYMQAKQTGQSGMQALIQAFAAGSGMGSASHREESTQLVVQAFLQALGGMQSR